jgi:copper chaperone CopZ
MTRICTLLVIAGGLTLIGCASSTTPDVSATTRPAASEPSGIIDASQATLTVFGMSCPQCSNNLNLQLSAIDGVDNVDVDLGSGDIVVSLQPGKVTVEALRSRVLIAGYTLDSIRIPA